MSESDNINLSHITGGDVEPILQLYQKVAARPGGIAREVHEITPEYIKNFVTNTISRGVGLVARHNQQVVGTIHTYTPEPQCFSHVLGDLTIAVDPDFQGRGVGRLLFTQLLREVQANQPQIQRIELVARVSNQKAIAFYKSMGFETEGELKSRIKNSDGTLESDIPMAWLKPKN